MEPWPVTCLQTHVVQATYIALTARSQIHFAKDTLANLQSLANCLDHRGIASDTVRNQARVHYAAQCIEMHLGGI